MPFSCAILGVDIISSNFQTLITFQIKAEITFWFSTGMQCRTYSEQLPVDLNEIVTVWVTKQEPRGVNPVVKIKNRKIKLCGEGLTRVCVEDTLSPCVVGSRIWYQKYLYAS